MSSSSDAAAAAAAPPRPVNDAARVYVGGLMPECTEQDLRTLFHKYFPVRIELKNGFAFVELEEVVDAQDAMKFLNGSEFQGRRLAVRPGGRDDRPSRQGQGPPRGGYGGPPPGAPYGAPPPTRGVAHGHRLIVEGLADITSWQDLKDFGRQAGASINVISFALPEDARRAVQMLDGQNLAGNTVRVYEDNGSAPRGPFPQGGGGGGYGGAPRGGYGAGGYGSGGYGGGYGRDDRGYGRDTRAPLPDDRRDYHSRDSRDYSRDSYRERRRSPSPQRDRRDRERERERSPPRDRQRSRSRSRGRREYSRSRSRSPDRYRRASLPRDQPPVQPSEGAAYADERRSRSRERSPRR